MNSQKTYLNKIGAAITLTFVLLLATDSAWAQAYLTEEFSVSDNNKIEARTSGGSIEVIGENTDVVRVEMYVRKNGKELDKEDTKLNNWDIEIEKKGDVVYAIAKREGNNWGRNNVSISFKIFTPHNTISDIRTSGGSLSMENLIGNQSGRTSGGSITAINIGGDIDLKTSGGSITLEDIEGFAEVNTSGGRIRAENLSGGIDASTSGGSITLEGITGNVDAKTSGGSINAEVMYPDEFIELKTSGGSITVTVPKDKGYDLDLDGNRVRADLQNFSGEYDKNDIRGTLNGGGTKIKAKTSGGSVSLKYL